jgi:hypothetical protein
MSKWLSWMRRLLGDDARDAWERERDAVDRAARPPRVDPRFATEARANRTAKDEILKLGRSVLEPDLPVCVPFDELVGRGHGVVTGSTATGKSFLLLLIALATLKRIARQPHAMGFWVSDHKSELVAYLQKLLAGLADELPAAEGYALLDRLVVLNPFSAEALVPMSLTRPDPGVAPEIHAWEVASLVNRIAGPGLGVKQDDLLQQLLLMAAVDNISFAKLVDLTSDPTALLATALRSSSEQVRTHFRGGLRVSGASLDGVRARLNRLVRLPTMRLQLGAENTLSFPDLLASRIVLVDVGSPPRGCEDIAAFWAGLLNLKFTRAVFSRSHADAARPVLALIDEWQESLQGDGDVASDYEKLLAMARSRGVSMYLCSQSLAGAAKVSATLPRVVATNTALQWCFRVSPDDARLLAPQLPLTLREPRPPRAPWEEAPRSPFLSASEEREWRASELTHLPDRTCWFWNRRRPYGAILMRTAALTVPALPFQDAERAWRIRNGTLAKPIAALRAEAAKGTQLFRPVTTAPATPQAPAPAPRATPRKARPRK